MHGLLFHKVENHDGVGRWAHCSKFFAHVAIPVKGADSRKVSCAWCVIQGMLDDVTDPDNHTNLTNFGRCRCTSRNCLLFHDVQRPICV